MPTPTPDLDPHRLHVAIHELGHYVAWRGLPGARILSVTVTGHGPRASGFTDAWLPDTERGPLERGYLIGLLAGHEAALIHQARTGLPSVPSCTADLATFRAARRHPKPTQQWSRAELRAAARALVRSHWPQIQKLAPRLAHRGHL